MSIKQVLQVTDQLLNLLEEEKKFLQARQLHKARHLLDMKKELSDQYDLAVKELKDNPIYLKQSTPELFDLIEKKTLNLQGAMQENLKKISIINEANSMILNAIVESSEQISKPVEQYTVLGRKLSSKPDCMPALTLDQYI